MNTDRLRCARENTSVHLRRCMLLVYLGVAFVILSGRDLQPTASASPGLQQEDKLKDSQFIAEGSRLFASACGNATYEREVWIVAGNMIERGTISDLIVNDAIDNRLRQFLMHWDGLRTACARAGSRLRLFCH